MTNNDEITAPFYKPTMLVFAEWDCFTIALLLGIRKLRLGSQLIIFRTRADTKRQKRNSLNPCCFLERKRCRRDPNGNTSSSWTVIARAQSKRREKCS